MGALVVAVAGAGWWVNGHPGVGQKATPAQPAAETGPAGTTLPAGVTTTTVLTLDNFGYPIGACVTWAQSRQTDVPTTEVACAQPHLVQLVSAPFDITGFGSDYPPDAALTAYYDQHCTPPAEKFLGYSLDPRGRFVASAVGPTSTGWDAGDRRAWCVMELAGSTKVGTAHQLILFRSDVRGANQEMLFPIGSCGTTSAAPVPCTGVHYWQVIGNVDLTGGRYPAGSSMWSAVGATCDSMARSFLQGPYPPDVQAGNLDLSSTSWSDGERTVQCTLDRFSAGGSAETIVGSLAGTGHK